MKSRSFALGGSKLMLVSFVVALAMVKSVAGSLLIADDNGVVREYDGATGAYRGVFASGGGLVSPAGMAVGPDGNLYVGDWDLKAVLRFNGRTGTFLGRFATASNWIYGLTFGPDNNLYAGLIGGPVQRFNGVTGASLGYFTPPHQDFGGMRFHNGSLFVTYGEFPGQLCQYNATNGAYIATIYGAFSGNGPRDPLFAPDGKLYVPDWQTPRVVKFDGTTLAYQGNLINDTNHSFPVALAIGPDGHLYVLDDQVGGQASVNRYNLARGAFETNFVAAGSGGLGRANYMLFADIPHAPMVILAGAQRLSGIEVLQLTWTNSCPTCALESAATLKSAWSTVSSDWVTNGNMVSTVVTSASPSRFYRLRMN
jgi:outer membrane protein assembly factor BamB